MTDDVRSVAPATAPYLTWPPRTDDRSPAIPIRRIPARLARRLAAVAVMVGAFIQVLAVGQRPGINVVLGIAALLAAATVVRRRTTPIDRLDLWMPVGALAFASFAAIRADRALVTFDAMAALALAFGWAAAMAGVAMTRRPLSALVVTGANCAVATAVGAIGSAPRSAPRATSARRSVGVPPCSAGCCWLFPCCWSSSRCSRRPMPSSPRSSDGCSLPTLSWATSHGAWWCWS